MPMTHLAGSDPLPPPELLPLSPVQTEIWLEQCKHPESSVFLLAMHYTIPAAIDAVRLGKTKRGQVLGFNIRKRLGGRSQSFKGCVSR